MPKDKIEGNFLLIDMEQVTAMGPSPEGGTLILLRNSEIIHVPKSFEVCETQFYKYAQQRTDSRLTHAVGSIAIVDQLTAVVCLLGTIGLAIAAPKANGAQEVDEVLSVIVHTLETAKGDYAWFNNWLKELGFKRSKDE